MYENLWSKSVWIPFWIVQLIASGIFLVLSALGLGLWKSYDDDYDYDYGSGYSSDRIDSAVYIGAGICIGISALTIVFNVVEIILFAVKRLSPVSVVVINCITTLIWLGMLILYIISATRVTSGIFPWILVIVTLGTSLGKLIYGSVILHRYRRRFSHRGGAYTSASTAVDPELESSPTSGLYTAYNGADTAAGPFRHAPQTTDQHLNGLAGEYYDPDSIRGYELPQHKATTRYA